MSGGPTWPPFSSSRQWATVASSSVRQIGPAVTNWSETRSSRTFMVLGPLDLVDVLVTDQEPPERLRNALETAGIDVIIAS